MERIGYVLLSIVAASWIIAMLTGMVVAFPFGLIGFVAILGIGFLFAKVVKNRIENKEDNYYSERVDK